MSQENDGDTAKNPLLFISHPHAFKAVADVLRTTIINWSGGKIQPRQTSDYDAATRHAPLTTGDTIRTELERILRDSNLILLLFVDATSANWSMYEAGFAKAGGKNPEDTRVVVVQCASEVPTVFESDLRISLTEDSVQQFTRDFHRSATFFPGLNEPYALDLPDKHVQDRAAALHSRLMDAWQLVQPHKEEEPEVAPRWILFTLSIDDTYVNQIYQLVDSGKSFEEAMSDSQELIKQHCVVQRCDPHLPKHFGLSRITDDRKFYTFYHRWRGKHEREGNPHYAGIDWWSQTCRQITYSAGAIDADEITAPFKSAAEAQTWYLMVITCQRTVPKEKRTEFDCTLIRIPENSKYIGVNVKELT